MGESDLSENSLNYPLKDIYNSRIGSTVVLACQQIVFLKLLLLFTIT